MQELLLINPAKRKRARRRNPTKKARARRRNPAMTFTPAKRAANPVHRRRRRRNPITTIKRASRRRRRNPIDIAGKDLGTIIKEAAIGGAGAVAADIAFGYLKPMLPADMQTGIAGVAAKAAVTAGLGIVLAKSMGSTGARMVMGALTVQAANFIREQVGPSIGLPMAGRGGVGYYTPMSVAGPGPARPIPRLGNSRARRDAGMGYYLNSAGPSSLGGMRMGVYPGEMDSYR